jgi:hypothetical protein
MIILKIDQFIGLGQVYISCSGALNRVISYDIPDIEVSLINVMSSTEYSMYVRMYQNDCQIKIGDFLHTAAIVHASLSQGGL